MTLQIVAGIAIGFALTFSLFACILAVIALLKVMAYEKSTHKIQFMPAEDVLKDVNADNEWATRPEKLNEQNKLVKEELEEAFPEFVNEDALEIKSF